MFSNALDNCNQNNAASTKIILDLVWCRSNMFRKRLLDDYQTMRTILSSCVSLKEQNGD